MYVCLCNAVTDTELVEAFEAGMDDIDEVGVMLGAGSCCGTCRVFVEELLNDFHTSKRVEKKTLFYEA